MAMRGKRNPKDAKAAAANDDTHDSDGLTMELEARRYEQMRELERRLTAKEVEIAEKNDELKDLKKQWDGILGELRSAARNEGEAPLFS